MSKRAVLLAITALLAFAAPAMAQNCPQTSLGDLEDEVMCPLCGRPLSTVDREPQAQRERAFMQRLIDQCKSKEEVKSALAAQFGPKVLALPDDDGFDLAAYLVPLAILLGAGAAIAVGVRRWRARPAAAAPGPVASTRDSKRLDDDLAKYDL
jgi:cytochrome c-type biogenesis protein CcmH